MTWLLGTRVGRWIVAVGGAVLAVLGLMFRAKRQGRSDAIRDFEEADRAEAEAIRKRADAEFVKRVPGKDYRGRRD